MVVAHQPRDELVEDVLLGVAFDLGLAEVDVDGRRDDYEAAEIGVPGFDGED